jgi:hypothetical protein
MHRAFGANVGHLTGALVASRASASTCHYSYGCGGTSQRLVIATLFVVVVVAAALSGGPRTGLAILACLQGRCGVAGMALCRLAHLSIGLKSSTTSWMPCVASFSSVFSSLTPW